MEKALERFARLMGTGVIITYLVGLFVGTATYFVGRLIGNDTSFAFAVGIALAVSVEVHSWLSQRLARNLWQQLHKMSETDERYDDIRAQFKLHMWITVGLVVFSMVNSMLFWYVTWPTAEKSAFDIVQIIIRGAVIPMAFLAAGFLTPLTHDASAMLADVAHSMLTKTTKAMAKQWKQRIKQAQRQKIDLAPIAISLMQDAGDHAAAKRIQVIADGLARAERGLAAPKSNLSVVPSLKLASTGATTATMTPPMEMQPEPTSETMAEAMAEPDEIYVVAKPKTSRAPSKNGATARNGANGRKAYPKRAQKTPEQKVRDAIAAAGGVDKINAYQVAKQTKVSTSTADKWWKRVAAGE
ncbi:MAG: hypothetical protein ACXWQ8_14015 [Ktedonobacterales bacterium]